MNNGILIRVSAAERATLMELASAAGKTLETYCLDRLILRTQAISGIVKLDAPFDSKIPSRTATTIPVSRSQDHMITIPAAARTGFEQYGEPSLAQMLEPGGEYDADEDDETA